MAKIKRFFECLIPVTLCNLECPYCYIIQENRRKLKLANLRYSPEHIAKALCKERLGGTCYISICGAGETLAQKEVIDIVRLLLEEGHYVNITTNGTFSSRFDKLISECGSNIHRLHVSFSLHYLELKRKNLIDKFFENINKIKVAGGSYLLQFNLCDEYIPYIDEIKKLSIKYTGELPQVALTRNETTKPISIHSSLSREEYLEYGEEFSSPLFEFTAKNFNVKRKEFCYAGDWSGVLNLETGWLSRCYASNDGINIFEDINSPIEFKAIGKHCKSPYCINSSHFLSWGVIPNLDTPSYGELRERDGWYSDNMSKTLSHKLSDTNSEYSAFQKFRINYSPKIIVSDIILSGYNMMPQRLKEMMHKIIQMKIEKKK